MGGPRLLLYMSPLCSLLGGKRAKHGSKRSVQPPHPHIRPPCTIFHQCILAFRLLCLPSENSAQHTSDSISSRPVSQLGPQRPGQRHPCRFQPAFAISELSNQCKRLYRATIIDFAAKPVSLQCQSCSWTLCRDVPPPSDAACAVSESSPRHRRCPQLIVPAPYLVLDICSWVLLRRRTSTALRAAYIHST